MKRRRVLGLIAAAAVLPQAARAEVVWEGRALGAPARLVLRGDRRAAEAALADLPGLIAGIEGAFSLYRPSELTQLNARGHLDPSPGFAALTDLADRVHHATEGLFDPSIQPLWAALAQGTDPAPARAAIGWGRIARDSHSGAIGLERGQALSFNGIAQGWAADRVREMLARHGFDMALVDLGEVATLGGPWRLGLADPAAGILAERRLTGGAIATSSAEGTRVGGQSHILHPAGGQVHWSSVTVEAPDAALADALSTALILAPRPQIRRILTRLPEVTRVTLVDHDGNLETIAA